MDSQLLGQLLASGVIVALITAASNIVIRLLPPPREPAKVTETVTSVAPIVPPAFLPDYERVIQQLRDQIALLQGQIRHQADQIDDLVARAETAETHEQQLREEVRQLRRQVNGGSAHY